MRPCAHNSTSRPPLAAHHTLTRTPQLNPDDPQSVNEDWAELFINDRSIGVVPTRTKLSPGRATLGSSPMTETHDTTEAKLRWLEELSEESLHAGSEQHVVAKVAERGVSLAFDATRRGDAVVFKRAAMGSYFIRIDGQMGVKGKRID